MPGWPDYDILDPTANTHRETGFSIGFVGLDGTTYSMRIGGLGAGFDIVIGDKMALAEAAGALSNMGVYRLTEDKVTERRIADATASDDAYANPASVLSMHFENNNMEKLVIDLPAPDAALFESDGVTLKALDDPDVGTLITAFVNAATSAINSTWVPNNSFVFVRGVRRTRKVKLPQGQGALPGTIQEPAAPLDEPA